MSTPQLLSMGISGYGMVGDDIGGFAGSPLLIYDTVFEVGAFQPDLPRPHGEGYGRSRAVGAWAVT